MGGQPHLLAHLVLGSPGATAISSNLIIGRGTKQCPSRTRPSLPTTSDQSCDGWNPNLPLYSREQWRLIAVHALEWGKICGNRREGVMSELHPQRANWITTGLRSTGTYRRLGGQPSGVDSQLWTCKTCSSTSHWTAPRTQAQGSM